MQTIVCQTGSSTAQSGEWYGCEHHGEPRATSAHFQRRSTPLPSGRFIKSLRISRQEAGNSFEGVITLIWHPFENQIWKEQCLMRSERSGCLLRFEDEAGCKVRTRRRPTHFMVATEREQNNRPSTARQTVRPIRTNSTWLLIVRFSGFRHHCQGSGMLTGSPKVLLAVGLQSAGQNNSKDP